MSAALVKTIMKRCRRCGKAASFVCSSCKVAPYCSSVCQTFDWKEGGHRDLCRGPKSNQKIHIILRELFLVEWVWLKDVASRDFRSLFFHEDTEEWPLNHLFTAGHVALVLARGQPCALLGHDRFRHQPHYYADCYFKHVLSPWYEEHKTFLNEEGFYMEVIEHGVFLSDSPCPCLKNGKLCGNPADFGSGAVLIKDTRSSKIELVNKVFCTERSTNEDTWGDGETVSYEDFKSCTCFAPTAGETGNEARSYVTYVFEFCSQVFGEDADDLCCSQCFYFENYIAPEDATALGKHFHGCYKAMSSVGFYIGLDVLQQEGWPDESLAELWFAAAGENINTFNTWIENELALCVRIDDKERMASIVARIRELASLP